MSNSENELLIRINGTAKDFISELDRVTSKTKDVEKVLSDVAKKSAIAFAAFTGTIYLTTQAFADYETALVGVGKTTNITGDALKSFGKEFQKLATTIPLSTNELLGIAQAAGQLGVKGEENLLKFTDTVAKLGVSTDLSGQEAATALARILNVTGENIQSIDKLGSVIVAMGNNFAASESEIVRVTTEVARSTAVFNVSSASSVALATAMRSLGIQAELGGSAVGRTFRAIDKSLRTGGQSLLNLEKVTGMTGEQLKKTFKDDSVAVFKAFIEGLGKIDEQGGSTTATLAAFGLKGDEILKVLPVLAKNSQILGQTLSLAGKETKNATALNNEAANAFNTLNSDVQRMKNSFETLKVSIGEKLAPEVRGLVNSVSDLFKFISNLDQSTISIIASFLKWGAIIAGVVTGIAGLAFTALKASAAFDIIITALYPFLAGLPILLAPATAAASAFWLAMTGPVGIAIAALTAVTIGAAVAYKAMANKEPIDTLAQINAETQRLINKQKELNAVKVGANADYIDAEIKMIDKQIDKLDDLRRAKLRSAADFGTGEFLVQPKAQGTLSDLIPSFGKSPTIPLAVSATGGGDAANKAKADQKAADDIVNEATGARIAAARREAQTLKEIQAERNAGLLTEDMKYIQLEAQIEEERAAAKLIKNKTERDLTLANIDAKHAEELAKIDEFYLQEDELETTRQQEKAALAEAMRIEKVTQRDQFNTEDLQAFQTSIDSQAEAQKKFDTDKIKKNIDVHNQFQQDELKYGTAIANMKKFFNSEEVQGVQSTTGDLAQLMNSRNSTMKGIGKAAASTNAAIATAEGAIKAYTSLAGIPIIGPALGIAAATALTLYGVEQQSKILGANQGGIVPHSFGGISGQDSVPAMLTPNELVVPAKSFDEVVNATADARKGNAESSGGSTINNYIQGDFYGEETFIDRLAEKLYDAQKTRNVRLING